MRKLLNPYLAKPKYNAEAVKKTASAYIYALPPIVVDLLCTHDGMTDLSFQLKLLYVKLREIRSSV
jgi:hypothetical protein